VNITIRDAEAHDYDALCALTGQVDAQHRDNLPDRFQKPRGPVRERDYILNLLSDENVGLFVAEVDGKVVGFVHVAIRETSPIPIFVPRRYGVIDTIAVDADLRLAGIGRALMDSAHKWALDKGASAVELNVYEFNEGALSFYHALGYEPVSRQLSRQLTERED